MEDDPKYTWAEACALGIVKTYRFHGEHWHPAINSQCTISIPARSEAAAWEALAKHESQFINFKLIKTS